MALVTKLELKLARALTGGERVPAAPSKTYQKLRKKNSANKRNLNKALW